MVPSRCALCRHEGVRERVTTTFPGAATRGQLVEGLNRQDAKDAKGDLLCFTDRTTCSPPPSVVTSVVASDRPSAQVEGFGFRGISQVENPRDQGSSLDPAQGGMPPRGAPVASSVLGASGRRCPARY